MCKIEGFCIVKFMTYDNTIVLLAEAKLFIMFKKNLISLSVLNVVGFR